MHTLKTILIAFILTVCGGLSSSEFLEKKALVAGGAGFLGSHLCERLLDEGYEVICLDNFQTGAKKNIQHLTENPYFSVIEMDVCNLIRIESRLDEIYNLACPASPPKYQRDPVHTLKTNFLGTLNLLELAKEKEAIFFQASTSEVYGDPQIHPQVETYWGNVNPIGIRACYDEGKRSAETLCFEFHRQYGVAIKVARIFNTYGPKMAADDGRVVSNFINQAISGESLTLFGDGEQTRSFCYVDDLIEGFRRLMKTPYTCTGPVNLGNPVEFTVRDFAAYVTELSGSTSEIRYLPLPKDDPTRRRPDISKAKELLDWEPQVSVEIGIRRTIKYFEEI